MQIIAVSFNPPEDNVPWVQEQSFEFEIWTDKDKSLALYYGAADNKAAFFPTRITKILGWDGELVLEYDTVTVDSHPADVLADCTLLFGG